MSLSYISKIKTPYLVSERNYGIKLIQSQEINLHSIFFTYPQETVDYHYEQKPFDPRISHNLVLDVDPFGNIVRSVAVGYGRQNPDPKLSLERSKNRLSS